MDTDPVLALLKFGLRAHIDDFVRGMLHMNTLQYFAQMEAAQYDNLRCDPFEGVGRLIHADGATLSVEIEGAYQPVGRLAGPIQWPSRHFDGSPRRETSTQVGIIKDSEDTGGARQLGG